MRTRSPRWTPGEVRFVSFYTPDYSPYAKRMLASLERHGLEYDVTCIRGLKGWQGAVRHKPHFILEMLKKHADAKALVWVDADSEVNNREALDVFWRLKSGMAAPVKHWVRIQKDEIVCNVMFFQTHDKVRKAVERWIEKTKTIAPNAETPEQEALQGLVWPGEEGIGLGVRFHELPVTLSFHLTDRMQRAGFWQYQVSRKHNPRQLAKRAAKQKAQTQ